MRICLVADKHCVKGKSVIAPTGLTSIVTLESVPPYWHHALNFTTPIWTTLRRAC